MLHVCVCFMSSAHSKTEKFQILTLSLKFVRCSVPTQQATYSKSSLYKKGTIAANCILYKQSYKNTTYFWHSHLCLGGAESCLIAVSQQHSTKFTHVRLSETSQHSQWQLHLSVHHLPSSWKRAAARVSTRLGILSHWHSALQRWISASRRYRDRECRAVIPPSSRGTSDTRGLTAHWNTAGERWALSMRTDAREHLHTLARAANRHWACAQRHNRQLQAQLLRRV